MLSVKRINEIIEQVKKAIAALTQEISVLKEYKVCLVADTVTGKIDIRRIKNPDYEYIAEEIGTENNNQTEGEADEK